MEEQRGREAADGEEWRTGGRLSRRGVLPARPQIILSWMVGGIEETTGRSSFDFLSLRKQYVLKETKKSKKKEKKNKENKEKGVGSGSRLPASISGLHP